MIPTRSLLALLALSVPAAAQTTLVANTTNNNGLTAGMPGLFFDFTAAGSDVTVIELSTASNRAPGVTFDLEVYTRVGSGLGGPVASGPGSSPVGWTSQGVVTATQGAMQNGTSLPIDIPDVFVPAGQTVGVALVYLGGGSRYFGTGSTPPQVFTDGDLTLTTGNSRSMPFTPSGSFFESRGLHGEVTYVLGAPGGIGTSYCGPAVPNSTGAPGVLSATGSTDVAANDVTLVAADLPTMAFGFFLASQAQGNVPMPGGSQGTLCLGGNIGRYVGPGQIQNSGASGAISLALDLTQMPTPSGFVAAAPGETWNFQAWHRDASGGTVTSNFTQGLSIDLQ